MMQVGTWVMRAEQADRPCYVWDVGKIIHLYEDHPGIADICLYSTDGTKLGRSSPAEGGPTKFEPWCELSSWVGIQKPRFPLPVPCVSDELVNMHRGLLVEGT